MKKGISLIVLVITIVVSLILLSVVVLNFQDNDITNKASKVQFQSNVKTYQDAALMYISKEKLDAASETPNVVFDATTINVTLADSNNIAGVPIKSVDNDRFVIKKGQFAYVSTESFSPDELLWLSEIGVKADTSIT